MSLTLEKKEKLLSLEKEVAQHAPHMLSLVKSANVTLEKKGLLGHTAQVALVLDISGSMGNLYRNGKVQKLVERALALASRFDDNGAIDIFLFGQHAHDVGELRVSGINGYVERVMRQFSLENSTHYARAMECVINHYFPKRVQGQVTKAQFPVYVLFVTDGAANDKPQATHLIQAASYLPIFWAFVGIGKSNRNVDTMLRQARAPQRAHNLLARLFGAGNGLASPQKGSTDFEFLEALDDLKGRLIDNAGFFSVTDPSAIDDSDLYDLLTFEYPAFLELARGKNMLPRSQQ